MDLLTVNQCFVPNNVSRMFKPPRMGRIHTHTSLYDPERLTFLKK